MRTNIEPDDDILRVARHLAKEREQSSGRVLSDRVHSGSHPASTVAARPGKVPILPGTPAAQRVTGQTVKELLESEV